MSALLTLADSATRPILNFTPRDTEPSDPAEKDIYLDDGTNTASGNPGFRQYIGAAWIDLHDSADAALPNYGSPATKTISSGVVATGSDRNLVIAAESGTAGDLVEITGLTVGDKVLLRADTGDTITVKHNSGSATIKIHLYANADVVLGELNALELTLVSTNVLSQPIDATGAGVFKGSDGIAFTDPTAQTWTNLNHGSGTYDKTSNARLAIKDDANGSTNVRGWYMTAPSAPYTVTAYVKGNFPLTATNGYFFGHRENTSGELVGLLHLYSTAVGQWIVSKFNSATSFNASYGSVQTLAREAHWLRIVDDNTNLTWQVSSDGTMWHTIDQRTRTDWLTPDRIFFGLYTSSAATALDLTAAMESLAFT